MNSMKDRTEAIEDNDDLDATIPGSVFNKRQARILRNAVIIMGLMLVAGFALLIGIIAYRASQPAPTPTPIAPLGVGVPHSAGPAQTLPVQTSMTATPGVARKIEAMIPSKATYLGSAINGNRLVLTLQTPGKGLSLMMIDLQSWTVIGTAQLKPEDQK